MGKGITEGFLPNAHWNFVRAQVVANWVYVPLSTAAPRGRSLTETETALTQLIPNPVVVPVGLLIGVLVSAPVGPVNVLCINRAIERGFWGGVAAGLGAVLSDGLISSIAVLGVGTLSRTIQQYRDAIQFMGGVAVIAFGFRLLRTGPQA